MFNHQPQSADRESQLKGRLRLRHLLEVTEARGEEMAELAPRFERLADPGLSPRVVSSFNLFQTPEQLANRMVELLNGRSGRMLEPSAGLGRLYRAFRKVSDSHVTLVENAADCCRELYLATESDSECRLIQADFLQCGESRLGLFDVILMNPPFHMGADIKHILHACSLLAPGGRLVAICANGNKRRAALSQLASQWIDLPSGSFRSEGTNVETAMIVIDR